MIVNFVYCFAYDYEPLRIYDFLLIKDLAYIAFFSPEFTYVLAVFCLFSACPNVLGLFCGHTFLFPSFDEN